jgi:predicted esterase
VKSHLFRAIGATRAAVYAVVGAVVLFFSAAGAPRFAAKERLRPEPVTPREVDRHARTLRSDIVRGKYPSTPLALHDEGGTILAFPPGTTARKPITTIYLHGIHGRAENGCPWLREGASEIGWLVCPSANAHLSNDTFSWAGTTLDQRAVVARAERAAQAQGADAESANVIVGFSQGAFVALDLVRARLGRYRGLVLIGADVDPSKEALDAAGVGRIVLAAGELDASFAPLQRAAARLRRAGADARFVDLGRIGHSYATTEKEALRDAIAWAGGSA